jgi:hypothetical protein
MYNKYIIPSEAEDYNRIMKALILSRVSFLLPLPPLTLKIRIAEELITQPLRMHRLETRSCNPLRLIQFINQTFHSFPCTNNKSRAS